jgi:phosphate transport system permease protein
VQKNNSIKTEIKKRKSEVRHSDLAFLYLLRFIAFIVIFIFISLILYLGKGSLPVLKQFGLSFFTNTDWDPNSDQFGALPFIYGTLLTSIIALIIAAPIAVSSALFLTEIAPQKIAKPFGFFIEMLSAIPSVVYGLWGIFILAPFVREWIQPSIGKYLGFMPFFKGPPFGIGIFTSGLILAIMILPTITAVCREIFLTIPTSLREGVVALGTTRWEMIKTAVLEASFSGILAAIALGFGRAMGETMAVTMLIGNRPSISLSLFSPGATMASVIANESPEATSDLHVSSLAAIGLTLFLVSLTVSGLARLVTHLTKRRFSK